MRDVAAGRKEVVCLTDKYESQMKKGVLDMLVLKLLSRQDMYGYEIITRLGEQSRNRFVLKEGTLYPILYRLEDDGLIISHWSGAQGRHKPRKYYSLTEEGRQTLEEITELWASVCESVGRIMEG